MLTQVRAPQKAIWIENQPRPVFRKLIITLLGSNSVVEELFILIYSSSIDKIKLIVLARLIQTKPISCLSTNIFGQRARRVNQKLFLECLNQNFLPLVKDEKDVECNTSFVKRDTSK